MDFGFVAIPAITVIVYLIVEAFKASPLDNKWLPIIAGVCGAVLGVVTYFAAPQGGLIESIAIGIVSGFAATGVNQVFKQQQKDE